MWPTIERTRRRLFGGAADQGDTSAVPVPTDGATSLAVRPDDAALDRGTILTLGRPDLDRLGAALVALLGPATVRPDTPARLEHALGEATAALGHTARVSVERLPAGVTTPEAWQVRLSEADADTVAAIREAIRLGSFVR
jgi:hypothetical protein